MASSQAVITFCPAYLSHYVDVLGQNFAGRKFKILEVGLPID